MPLLINTFYEKTNHSKTNQYIETGCYKGDGIKEVLNHYNTIHSVELAETWYHYNVEQFKQYSHVFLHLGDSKKLLPKLLSSIKEPITIHLDAHYSGGTTAFGEEETPLLFELELLKNRPYDDIIIIDDCRLLGTSGVCGCGPEDPVYPTINFDWRDITKEAVHNLIKSDYVVFDNVHKEYSTGAWDQLILSKVFK